jgi:hypothetical protein
VESALPSVTVLHQFVCSVPLETSHSKHVIGAVSMTVLLYPFDCEFCLTLQLSLDAALLKTGFGLCSNYQLVQVSTVGMFSTKNVSIVVRLL